MAFPLSAESVGYRAGVKGIETASRLLLSNTWMILRDSRQDP